MKKIVIVTAMTEELDPLLAHFQPELYAIKNMLFPTYKLITTPAKEEKVEVLLTSTGIGKVNASFSMTNIVLQEHPDLVINLGTAGGVSQKLEILDLVVAQKLAYHDVDVTAFGYEYGQVPGQERYFDLSQQKCWPQIEKMNSDYHYGTILSGDKFINSSHESLQLAKQFNNVYAVEMESTAIADICQKLGVEVVIVRGISDLAHQESTLEFDKYLEQVAVKFIAVVEYWIKKLSTKSIKN